MRSNSELKLKIILKIIKDIDKITNNSIVNIGISYVDCEKKLRDHSFTIHLCIQKVNRSIILNFEP